MAVVRVVGNVDGKQIVFGKSEDGHWVTSVPKDLDGEYVVEVTAYDEAGNEAYSASMLFIVDPFSLKVKMVPVQFSTVVFEKHNETIDKLDFVYINTEHNFSFRLIPENFAVGGELGK